MRPILRQRITESLPTGIASDADTIERVGAFYKELVAPVLPAERSVRILDVGASHWVFNDYAHDLRSRGMSVPLGFNLLGTGIRGVRKV